MVAVVVVLVVAVVVVPVVVPGFRRNRRHRVHRHDPRLAPAVAAAPRRSPPFPLRSTKLASTTPPVPDGPGPARLGRRTSPLLLSKAGWALACSTIGAANPFCCQLGYPCFSRAPPWAGASVIIPTARGGTFFTSAGAVIVSSFRAGPLPARQGRKARKPPSTLPARSSACSLHSAPSMLPARSYLACSRMAATLHQARSEHAPSMRPGLSSREGMQAAFDGKFGDVRLPTARQIFTDRSAEPVAIRFPPSAATLQTSRAWPRRFWTHWRCSKSQIRTERSMPSEFAKKHLGIRPVKSGSVAGRSAQEVFWVQKRPPRCRKFKFLKIESMKFELLGPCPQKFELL